MLTDIPIGAWTSAFVLDLFGGRRAQPAADGLIALGLVSAIPTAAAGLADWSDLPQRGRRVGVVHAAANAAGVVLYAWSLAARRRGRRGRGVVLGFGAAGVLTAGGYLGGHLAFGLGSNPDEVATEVASGPAGPKADDWTTRHASAASNRCSRAGGAGAPRLRSKRSLVGAEGFAELVLGHV